MKIAEVEAYLCHYPLTETFYPTWIPAYPQTQNSCLILILRTDEGIEGCCAGVAFLDEAKGVVSLLRPFLLGRDPFQIEDTLKLLRSASFLGYKGWFVEPALWDIVGKASEQPVYRLLGGGQDKILAYGSTGELHPPEQRAEEMLALKGMGFKAVKLRVKAERLEDDIALIEAVRIAVGDDMEIMVDANQGWPIHGFGPYPRWSLKRAMEEASAMEEYGIRWLEEPLYKHDYDGYAHLRSSTNVPIAGGEFNSDLHEFRELISGGCLDVVQPDVTLSTGILNGKKVAGMAEAYNLEFSPHTWTNGLGLAANLQLMASVPDCPYCEFPYEPPGWVPEARDFMLSEPLMIDEEGYIAVPQGPGLGIELDMEQIKARGEKL
ncbi:MAG: mandelate racemase/muconate lactonizing enzyme family protein [Dehalococcoidia bacterium]|nr:MAG: mandelate racemase/muconate lactonizing enzyme family protein [Dehalococcoidia bacterium]